MWKSRQWTMPGWGWVGGWVARGFGLSGCPLKAIKGHDFGGWVV
ncbi:hypothetical protein ACFLX4_01215 [Chloroflexota bacterium]